MKEKFTQPSLSVAICEEFGVFYVDIESSVKPNKLGDVGCAEIATARTAGASLRRAAKRLRELADQCDKRSRIYG